MRSLRDVLLVSILVSAAVPLSACGSSSGGSGGATGPMETNDSGTTTTDDACDHVVASGSLTDVSAIATDGTDIFTLPEVGSGDMHISMVKNGALTQVADVPSDGTFFLQTPGLLVDADNFYVTASQNKVLGIYRIPRTGGGAPVLLAKTGTNGIQYPHFVSDATYLYYQGSDANSSLTRVPMAGGAEEIVNGSSFENLGNFGGVTMAVDDTSVYTFINGESAGEYDLTIVPKAPPAQGTNPAEPNYLTFSLGSNCTSSSPYFAVTGSGYVAACTDNGSVPMAMIQGWLYALPTAAPNATGVVGTKLAVGATVDFATFAVANGNAYYDDSYDSTTQAHVYKLSTSGGSPTPLMQTWGVSKMLVMGTNLVVASGCGIQEVGL